MRAAAVATKVRATSRSNKRTNLFLVAVLRKRKARPNIAKNDRRSGIDVTSMATWVSPEKGRLPPAPFLQCSYLLICVSKIKCEWGFDSITEADLATDYADFTDYCLTLLFLSIEIAKDPLEWSSFARKVLNPTCGSWWIVQVRPTKKG